ncbi:Phycocyanobilin lyase subunit CpcS [Porphyridium purpureum]|uniref:Phycocyanobilin lyase subunit CpcS n=1 Tax=Porphyridium purpureum TaxID=35688 RepID=A0A5J4YSP0_PORPP|nr:Phycocyanobilin lyase subunit CpcS [Porphyridium purpureum]|eukprot:POR0397..scf227_4
MAFVGSVCVWYGGARGACAGTGTGADAPRHAQFVQHASSSARLRAARTSRRGCGRRVTVAMAGSKDDLEALKSSLKMDWPEELLEQYVNSDYFKAQSKPRIGAADASAAGTTLPASEKVRVKDAMEFFRKREGQWTSWRVTHHLAFRRAETGESNISMQCLEADDERIRELCVAHELPENQAVGGCYVTWKAQMGWDQEGESHEGSTVFALVPDEGSNGRRGRILRDRGYAEIVQIAGTYFLDDGDDLNLVTPYDGGEVVEKFAFDGPDIVNRVSTVKRFGGYANSTFATERRRGFGVPDPELELTIDEFSILDPASDTSGADDALAAPMYGARARSRTYGRGVSSVSDAAKRMAAQGPPSMRSAFSSGFGSSESASDNAASTTTPSAGGEDAVRAPPARGPPSVRSAFSSGFSGSSSSNINISKNNTDRDPSSQDRTQ